MRRGEGRLHSREDTQENGALELNLQGLDFRPGSVALPLVLVAKAANTSEVVLRGLELLSQAGRRDAVLVEGLL